MHFEHNLISALSLMHFEHNLISALSFDALHTLSGRTGSALAWRSEGRTFASQSVQ